jgi:hypothetical protein
MFAPYQINDRDRNDVNDICQRICELFIFYFILAYVSWYIALWVVS